MFCILDTIDGVFPGTVGTLSNTHSLSLNAKHAECFLVAVTTAADDDCSR